MSATFAMKTTNGKLVNSYIETGDEFDFYSFSEGGIPYMTDSYEELKFWIAEANAGAACCYNASGLGILKDAKIVEVEVRVVDASPDLIRVDGAL